MPGTSFSTLITWARPDLVPRGRSTWVIAGDHRWNEADSGEEHLHLLERGVLTLRREMMKLLLAAAAHVGQRAISITLRSMQLGRVSKPSISYNAS